MSEAEKFIIKMLKDSQNTYIEDKKVTQVVLTTEEAKILLNLIENKQNEKEPKYIFKIVYVNKDYDGFYDKDKKHNITVVAKNKEEAIKKMEDIEKDEPSTYKCVLGWNAEELLKE